MIRTYEFAGYHVRAARAHPRQVAYQWMFDDPMAFYALWPDTVSAFDGVPWNGGELIAIGGTTLIDGESGGWVLFTDKITPARFLPIHRTVVRYLVCFEQINDPIFAPVDPDWPEAVRWSQLLGMDTRRTDVLPGGRTVRRVSSVS